MVPSILPKNKLENSNFCPCLCSFYGRIENTKKFFWNYLTFSRNISKRVISIKMAFRHIALISSFAHLLISFASWLIHIYPKRLLKRPFFLVVVAGVVVVAFPSIAFTASFTRPVDVFGVAPAPAPVKITIFTVQC